MYIQYVCMYCIYIHTTHKHREGENQMWGVCLTSLFIKLKDERPKIMSNYVWDGLTPSILVFILPKQGWYLNISLSLSLGGVLKTHHIVAAILSDQPKPVCDICCTMSVVAANNDDNTFLQPAASSLHLPDHHKPFMRGSLNTVDVLWRLLKFF